MLTSHCRICGQSKTSDYFAQNECKDCETLGNAAAKAVRDNAPDASDSDVLYARRQALNQRAHHAHRNFVDPRQHARLSLPTDPSNGPA